MSVPARDATSTEPVGAPARPAPSTRGRGGGGVVMVDVARAAGVSQKTVSRVVNGSSQVRPEVTARVQRAIDELGYRRNAAARALVRGRTHVVGVVGLRTALYGVAQHVMSLERAAKEAGFGVVVVSTETGDPAEVVVAVERALELGAEGVVLAEPFFDTRTALDAFARTPFVTVVRSVHDDGHVPAVDADQEAGADLVVDHLVGLGHRRVGYLAGPTAWRSALVREQATAAALRRHGLPVLEPARGDWTARSGYAAARELLAREDVTAVVAANDHMAVGALRALAEAGLSVPGDVSLVGFDDVPEAEFLPVPLTTVRQTLSHVGELALRTLVELVEDGPGAHDRVHVVPVTLEVRASTGRAPGGGRGD
ncbi:LacI family transcriptional regulator [Pseudokineococcus lusitanus]|uniref:LacI family transcriptional regulator n=1 Tax=Pseudokineococcus lusitanus TaxID=763993 RepID=A0A3N1GWE2_9ACTN|nr:LacI family transcriptional regulator [Pseudokineococcus lusitanus]